MTAGTDSVFQVDLRGVVDLLARHLYSGPRVYLRELLQNAVDAITARRMLDPDAPTTVRIRVDEDGYLEVTDSGVGLTLTEAADVLATIGRSSKRDLELGTGRREFLGQFGIGLLSAFLVADEVELVSRSAREGARPIRWTGSSDGTYQLAEVDLDMAVGSVVRLRPRPDDAHWVVPETVVALAEDFGSMLDADVAVEVPLSTGGTTWRRTTRRPPWARAGREEGARKADLVDYCERSFAFTPMAVVDLDLEWAGLTGAAFVLPRSASPSSSGAHRVHLKGMLLGDRVAGLVPEWAFFVRCVVDSDQLRPTASREDLYDDDLLLSVRQAIGVRLREWLTTVLAVPTPLRRQFLETHHLAVRALALTDDDMLETAALVLPYETTDGMRTLAEAGEAWPELLYATSVEEYRRLAPVAAAQGVGVVNAGYVYDADLLERLASRRPTWRVRPVRATDVGQILEEVDEARAAAAADALRAGTASLAGHDVEVVLRRFEPAALPAFLLHDRDGDHQRDLRATAATRDLWGQVLDAFATVVEPRRLVLNDAHPLVRDLLEAPPGAVRDAGFHALYVTALLSAGEPLRAAENDLLGGSLSTLLRSGLGDRSRHASQEDPR